MGDDTTDTAHARFDRLFDAFETPIRNYCARRIDRASVDDAVNDTFAVAWRKLDIAPPGEAAARSIAGAGHPVDNDEPLDGYERVYVGDPFGNRIELLEPNRPDG